MIRKLLATTAVAAIAASGAYAQQAQTGTAEPQQQQQAQQQDQFQAEHEISVRSGDTVIIEAEREEAEVNLRIHTGAATGVQQQTPDQAAAPQDQQAQTEQQQAQVEQPATAVDRGEVQAADLQQISVDDLIGSNVYSVNDENIGNVNDVLLTQEGEVDTIVVDVGGFLGLGAHEVALGMDDLDVMADGQGNLHVYAPYTQEQLEGAPAYDQATWTEGRDEQRMTGQMAAQMPAGQQQDQQAQQQVPADQQQAQQQMAPGQAGEHVIADGGTVFVEADQAGFQLNFEVRLLGHDDAQVGAADDPTAEQQDMAATQPGDTAQPGVDPETTAAIDRDQMEPVEMQHVRADDLIGSTVYGANDDNIGSVGDILLTEDGNFDAVIVDVGGFLGIGAREVALGLDEVQFMRDQWEDWYIYTQYTQDQLEAAPEYDPATYAEQRDDQRIGIQ